MPNIPHNIPPEFINELLAKARYYNSESSRLGGFPNETGLNDETKKFVKRLSQMPENERLEAIRKKYGLANNVANNLDNPYDWWTEYNHNNNNQSIASTAPYVQPNNLGSQSIASTAPYVQPNNLGSQRSQMSNGVSSSSRGSRSSSRGSRSSSRARSTGSRSSSRARSTGSRRGSRSSSTGSRSSSRGTSRGRSSNRGTRRSR
jgi:hypothetical protein